MLPYKSSKELILESAKVLWAGTCLLVVLMAVLSCVGCSSGYRFRSILGTPGSDCGVAQVPNGAIITCEDGTSVFVPKGADGANGNNGTDGQNGVDGANGQDGTNGHDGADGHNGTDGANGQDGTNGHDGAAGHDGSNGVDGHDGSDGSDGHDGEDGSDGDDGYDSLIATTAASICGSAGGTTFLVGLDTNRDHALEGSEVTSSASVCNGASAAPSPFTIVAIKDPCGDAAGVYDEVMLQLQNGTIIASFSENSSGKNTRFATIPAGSYVTTDGSLCYFSVNASGTIYNEHY